VIIQQVDRPEGLFRHLFADNTGFLVTFVGQQARLTDPDARPNELSDTRQRYWRYPDEGEAAGEYLIDQAQRERDSYFGVHLFRESGNRLASNAAATVRALWLDEDDGGYPGVGPEPTAIVRSSASRRHLYWRLSRPVEVEWAVAMNRRLAAWAGGDSGKAGRSTVLRAPGTANYKRHPSVDLVVGYLTDAGSWEPEVLDQAIPEITAPSRPCETKPYTGPALDLAPFLESEHVEVRFELPDSMGIKYAIVCPWVDQHSGGDRTGTRIGQREGGGLWFRCDHAHCEGRTWREFRNEIRRRSPERRRVKRPGFTGPGWEVTINRG
jgi:hypothetical protein